MKHLLPFLLAMICLQVSAQNHVPNSSFEDYTNCPGSLSQMSFCNSWRMYTQGSSDYFNACATSTAPDVPNNFCGSQSALHGDAYAGVITYYHNTNGGNNYKEYIAAPITPLMIGATYEVSMYVSLSDLCGWATNDLGVFFYDAGPNTMAGNGLLNVTPQVSYNSYGNITDKTNWVRVSALFVADSAYDNIVIGGFTHTTSLTPTQVTGTSTMAQYAYYYIDSVSVKIRDTLSIAYNNNMICGTDSFMVTYNAMASVFSPANVFTIQLSDASGSFASPVAIGTKVGNMSGTIKVGLPSSITPGSGYRMRIVASNIPYTSWPTNSIAIGLAVPAKPVAISNSPICSGNDLTFSATTTSTVTGWQWTGPNNFSSTAPSNTINSATPAASGNYIVKAFNYGCVSSDTEAISVLQAPGQVMAGSNSPLCAFDTIKLTATTNLTGTIYTWTGPNSFTAGTRNVNITPATPSQSGDYIVTVNLNGCIKADTVSVLVYAAPAGFTATINSPLCEGDTIKLRTSSTTPGVTYNWTGPLSFNSIQPDIDIPNATGLHSGDYYITCSNNICSIKDTLTLQVKALPSPVIVSNNGPVCEGTNLGLIVTAGFPGTTFVWNGPNSYTSTGATTSVSSAPMTAAGDYVVTANYNGCFKKDTTTAVIKPVPVATASYSGATCDGQQITLSSTSNQPGSTFSWTGPASFSSTQQNPAISPVTLAGNGTYNVTATLNGCTSTPATVNVTVYAIPATPVATSNSPVCAGGTLNLSATSTTPGVIYSWTGPNSFTSNTQNPSILPVPLNGGGTYSVTAEANGCVSPAGSTNVIVNNVSSLGVYPSPNDTLCINSANASFVAVPFNAGTAPQYQWFKNNTLIAGATSISYPATAIADGDSFYCRMTVTGLCADPLVLYSNKVGMTVLPLTTGPSVTITADPGTLLSPWQMVKFTAVPTNAGVLPKFQWKRNGQDILGATSNVWSANNLSNLDTISCIVTSDVWCASPSTAASNRMVMNIKTGIADVDADKKLQLYPNPNNGSFVVYLPATHFKAGMISADVVDALGRTVYSVSNVQNPKSNIEFNLPASVANGVYMLKLSADDVMYHARFTVNR